MQRFLNLVRNKYFIVTLAFAVWMIFFDKNDVYTQYQQHQQVNKLKAERDFYKLETEKVSKDLEELTSDKARLEKFAREKYFMKKDNEDVFVVVKASADDK